MKRTKKEILYNLISRHLQTGGVLTTWAIEQFGKIIGIMGSSATRYARGYCEKGKIKKVGLHIYKGGK